MEDIKVSVLITYYNQKEYVHDSLTSALNQKVSFPIEILCGDDGSNDGTYEELLKYQDKYPNIVKVFRMPRVEGKKYEPIVRASNNRYNLLKNASGKYMTILDGDDYYIDNNKLQSQYDILENNNSICATCHEMERVWEDGSKREFIGPNAKRKLLMTVKEYIESYWLPAEAFLFRNDLEILNKINIDCFDDNSITLYYINKGMILYTPESMCAYRQLETSSWNARSEYEKSLVLINGYQELLEIHPEMKFSAYIRCHVAFEMTYANRHLVNLNDKGAKDLNAKIFVEAADYDNKSTLNKFLYCLKWFIPSHSVKLILLKVKFNKLKVYLRKI